jgi:3-hydroxybutyryl-CoA dehydrogenase
MVLKADQISRIGVLGAGLMGHGIAQAYAQEGYPVTITDSSASALAEVKGRIKANLDTLAREGLLPEGEVEPIMARITVADSLEGAVRDAQLVTEAVFEDLEIKRELFAQMEKYASPESILASNTSSFPMTQISSTMLVPLVEVVPGEKTSEETYQTAYEILRRVKKVPVRVQKEIIGFLINRIQTAMNREVYHLVEIGAASAEDVDRAVVTSLGFRLATLGPLMIRDLAGLDVTYKVDETLVGEIDSATSVNRLLADIVARGDLGAKTGQGFFTHTPESLAAIIRERDRQFIRLLQEQYRR